MQKGIYPELNDSIDHNYDILIPSRTDFIDRKNMPIYNSYEELFEGDFPKRKWVMEDIPGKGRGVICCRPIKAGELVFKERASILYIGPETKDENKDSTFELIKKVYEGNATATPSFVAQLAQNPSRENEFENHVQWMFNEFKNNSYQFKYEVVLDELRKIVNGIHTNSFSLDFQEGFGVFMGCSLVNHSCSENMGWHTVGDTMYYTALKDIEVGTELTISYSFPNVNSKRIRYYHDYYGFDCDCVLCTKGIDNWRVFDCIYCGGLIYPDENEWICHTCKRKSTQEEIFFYEAEEKAIMQFKHESRYRWFFRPLRKMSPYHMYLFKALRNYFMTQACSNPIQIAEEVLLPIAEFHRDISHGRLYAAILEQYSLVLLKYCQTVTILEEWCKKKALECLRKAYDYRCLIGMGISGYAAAIYLENLKYFDPENLKGPIVHYEEY
ncbi:hypothetical protein EHI8A_206130 [Entamoeba histolytica HM-1:IMSS-B]|uniref:SET domain-containing protein n=6 Tax=Entamoeba histolytica TaxID=5759 RepID=C4LV28_ENTH1|nr:hypothetical protein EHI_092690 [Entamoeba histolytica HM-1:IMSS]EMD49090.1 set and mynd domain containing protein [Entamoeba histolytica KU27]EMH74469.1 hypothetical protein EHI8A_206130 [Entamoeba histolytica HM-1:IMSS-B]EMS13339.1 set and mynd domain containing protein [Entamoeba histolytica HM-3:IMSS]ENY62002.1 set and mynd domain containing protein [Entamoeba histolytica HM-1:IMSS-A]GAT92503.1 hypothetical protein CL6EHI_092690 [Entamoeba histolytica]|eukprot:XP_651238.2 hypothetical protein EHI_092690 [Entamoeba histolytica HM-1:IMSS]